MTGAVAATHYLRRASSAGHPRRTDRPLESFERNLTCTGCGTLVAVFEAAHGWRVETDNHFTDAVTFRCLVCVDAAGLVMVE